MQHRSPAQLRAYQQELWQRQSRYVTEHSTFYQDLWAGEKAPANLADLPHLPLSEKAGLRASQAAAPPFGNYLAASREHVNRLHRTSGTTGQAMNLALSARDCEITESVGGRAQRLAGLEPRHSVVHCLNYPIT